MTFKWVKSIISSDKIDLRFIRLCTESKGWLVLATKGNVELTPDEATALGVALIEAGAKIRKPWEV